MPEMIRGGGTLAARGGGAGVGAGSRGGGETLDRVESESAGAAAVIGPMIRGHQTVQLTVDVFSDSREEVTPDQAEEEAVKDILLLRTSNMFME